MNIVELIATAGIITAVAYGGFSAYDRAGDDARIHTQQHTTTVLDDAIRAAYRGQSLDSLSPEIARLLAPDVPKRNGWGNEVRVEQLSLTDPREGYRIVDPVPARACVSYASRLARGFDRVEINGQVVGLGRGEIDAPELEAACSAGGATVNVGLVRYV
jgi:hypothetical protein